eukprot:365913-Chlamydomonas_euryale.AAC.8
MCLAGKQPCKKQHACIEGYSITRLAKEHAKTNLHGVHANTRLKGYDFAPWTSTRQGEKFAHCSRLTVNKPDTSQIQARYKPDSQIQAR